MQGQLGPRILVEETKKGDFNSQTPLFNHGFRMTLCIDPHIHVSSNSMGTECQKFGNYDEASH